MPKETLPPYLNLHAALREFVTVTGTQAQQHIRPIHKHVAVRLVLEGGFHPDEITPHPPLRLESQSGQHYLHPDTSLENAGEMTVLGGLKSKDVDVVVAKQGVGPVVAVSVEGTGNAFRNLTNRMEEAIGDSTNLHIMYPGLVYGFLHFLKASQEGKSELAPNDVAITAAGEIVSSIRRYHDVLLGLAGRRLVRDEITRYEAVAICLVVPHAPGLGSLRDDFPSPDSPLRISRFFDALYATYDLRFPYIAASVPSLRRLEWHADSPALKLIREHGEFSAVLGYSPRIA
jgi:hypothetical protein